MCAKFVYFVVFANFIWHSYAIVFSLCFSVAKFAVYELFVVAGGANAVPTFVWSHAFGTHVALRFQPAHAHAIVCDEDGAVSEAFAQFFEVESLRRFVQPFGHGDFLGGVQFRDFKKVPVGFDLVVWKGCA